MTLTFIDGLSTHLRNVTGTTGEVGTLSATQLFGSTINLHLHWHILALDGVYVRDSDVGPLRFIRAPAPTVSEGRRPREGTEPG